MYINEEGENLDNDLFNTISKTIHNQKEIKNSTNYKIMIDYLSKLKKTINGKKTSAETRIGIVQELLKNDNHFIELTEKLFDCRPSDRYFLLPKLVEFPLECMSSYIQGTTNSNTFLRRKYFDGQIRKTKDGNTYQRKYNISTESDLIYMGEDGKEYSPMEMVEYHDEYFDNVKDLLSVLNNDEKEVAICLYYLSTPKKRATIKEIVEQTHFTKRQVETLEMKIKFKVLKWLCDKGLQDSYKHYYDLCKKHKNFEIKYKSFCAKCEKTRN